MYARLEAVPAGGYLPSPVQPQVIPKLWSCLVFCRGRVRVASEQPKGPVDRAVPRLREDAGSASVQRRGFPSLGSCVHAVAVSSTSWLLLRTQR
ncbi:hypothetical protein NDU88_001657 [Pleurodeles waltl]|uniref:Uncharacterized protein n=1 Tax=Pleurodeles waltl TaxID=8319 RepID=A0AAV7ND40_PLEWA|nr:hypothetical protein NDU88_001657 [Pleurodeles waltl]